MIGETVGDIDSTDSLIVDGVPLTDTTGEITITIPDNFTGTLVYFCTNHLGMTQTFQIPQPIHGDLRFWAEKNFVVTYHHGGGSLSDNQPWRVTRDKTPNNLYITVPADRSGWRPYESPVGETELVEAGLDRILWTKDTRQNNELVLPDGRKILRRFVEYVVEGKIPHIFLHPSFRPTIICQIIISVPQPGFTDMAQTPKLVYPAMPNFTRSCILTLMNLH